jgi:tetratricopeptide (TPR) repeat protein
MLDPDFDEALNHLGYMWAERGINLQIARDMIERAVKAEPENPAYLDSLGWVLFQLKKPAEALPPLQKAVELLKEPDATVFDHLGDVLKALGRLPEAREAWQKSLAVEPSEAVKRKLEETP